MINPEEDWYKSKINEALNKAKQAIDDISCENMERTYAKEKLLELIRYANEAWERYWL